MNLALYDYFRSSASFRVRIALHLKNLPFDVIPIHLVNNNGEQHHEQYKKINPFALVPTLQNNQERLTQSIAIIEYLNELHPEPALLPNDIYTRAQCRSFALAIAADMHPLNNLRVLKYLTETLQISEDEKTNWYHHWINKGLSGLEEVLSQHAPNKYCFGSYPTLADICLIPQLYNARRFNCDLTSYPNLTRVEESCLAHPAFEAAIPREPVLGT